MQPVSFKMAPLSALSVLKASTIPQTTLVLVSVKLFLKNAFVISISNGNSFEAFIAYLECL